MNPFDPLGAMIRPDRPLPRRRPCHGFSLIELLTVIAIIGVLASIAVGLAGTAKRSRSKARADSELRGLQTAIEAYKADRGAYPPDHRLSAGSPQKVNPVVNQLFYELRGMEVVNGGRFRTRGGGAIQLTSDDVERVFGRRGFLNASDNPAEPAESYIDPKGSAVRQVAIDGVTVDLLATPFDWPLGADEPAPVTGSRINPWRYVSTGATNNPGAYDLWAEVYIGKDKSVFKNW